MALTHVDFRSESVVDVIVKRVLFDLFVSVSVLLRIMLVRESIKNDYFFLDLLTRWARAPVEKARKFERIC